MTDVIITYKIQVLSMDGPSNANANAGEFFFSFFFALGFLKPANIKNIIVRKGSSTYWPSVVFVETEILISFAFDQK